jgi:hypothetical protein
MELIEKIPLREINFLDEMDLKTFKRFSQNCKNEDERKQKFELLKAFCYSVIKTRGEITRVYSYTQLTPLEVGGRLYCGNSVQGLPKDIRGLLLRDTTTDIDMKNAHPVILKYLCLINNIKCPYLDYYIRNRETVLQEFGADGKTAFLKAVNDDKINKKISNEFFKNFDKECKVLQKAITSLECYKHIADSVPIVKTYNWLGSAINRILCVFENKILQKVISVCNSKQIEICALMFDGLMMYGNHYEDDELLFHITNEVNEEFSNEFGELDMVFCYKEHSKVIQIPDNYIVTVDEPVLAIITEGLSFEEISTEFEKTHCGIINKGYFIKEELDKIIIKTRSDIVTSYEKMVYEKIDKYGHITTENFIIDWLRNNPNQRCYDDMDCYPNKEDCPDNIYNTWRPFAMELVEEYEENLEGLETFLYLIKILCNNDDAVTNYLLAWIAQMIQFPEIKSICPTFISNQGAGKGTLMMLLAAMIGEKKYVETTLPSRDIWGHFNGQMKDTFLINLDELSRKESLECEGQIKGLITNPRMIINEKGVKQFSITSFHRWIATTNKQEPWQLTMDDRRHFIIRSSDELIGNKIFFDKCYKLLKDVNVIKTCYEYFKSIPGMKDFGKIKMPETEFSKDTKEAGICPIQNWIKSFVLDNYYQNSVELVGKKQYELFTEWCKKCGLAYNVSLPSFGVRLKRLNIPGIEKGKHTNKGETKIFNIIKLIEYFKLENIEMDTSNDSDNELDKE